MFWCLEEIYFSDFIDIKPKDSLGCSLQLQRNITLSRSQPLFALCEGSDDRTAITDTLEGWYSMRLTNQRRALARCKCGYIIEEVKMLNMVENQLPNTLSTSCYARDISPSLNPLAWIQSSLSGDLDLWYFIGSNKSEEHHVCRGNIWPTNLSTQTTSVTCI